MLGHTALYPYLGSGSAVSTEANVLKKAASELVAAAERSQALFGAKAEALAELRTMAIDCAQQGWDGHEANPISKVAVRTAEDFIRALPNGFPLPEFAPEPDGSVSVDWIHSRQRLYSLSIGTTHRLSFAWLDGYDKGHGVVRFDGFTVPPRVLADIRRIVLDADVAVRAT